MDLNKPTDFNILTKPEIKIIYRQQVTINTKVRLSVFREQLKLSDVPIWISSSICSVYVEMMNNMRMHSTMRQSPSHPLGVLHLGVDNDMYYLQSSNAVDTHKVENIQIQLERMNSHIKTELRKFYKFRRRRGNPNKDSQGAGLGMIEIAKRTSNPIDFDFKELGDGISFFTMLVKINRRSYLGGN